MADPVQERIRKAVGEAAEMVKGLPEVLQGVAFSKAFDALTGLPGPERAGVQPKPRRGRAGNESRGRGRAEGERGNGATSEAVATVMQKLDRTQHPHIRAGRKALDLALLVLRAARDVCAIEWLTAGEISAILKRKFNLPVDAPAVRMALKGARTYVDRKPAAQGYAYRLMGPGEEYLNTIIV